MASTTTSIHHIRPAGEATRTLDRIVETAGDIEGIWSHDVRLGDFLVVKTRNSTYSLAVLDNGLYRVTGGWFAVHADDGSDVRIAGCTWGGAVIHTRLVAAIGMFLEFDNGVRTTRIREVRLIRGTDGRKH